MGTESTCFLPRKPAAIKQSYPQLPYMADTSVLPTDTKSAKLLHTEWRHHRQRNRGEGQGGQLPPPTFRRGGHAPQNPSLMTSQVSQIYLYS